MSAAAATATGSAGDGGKAKGKRKLILLAVPVLLVAAGAGAYFGGLLDPLLGRKPAAPVAAAEQDTAKHLPPTFIDLPELITNLDTGGKRGSYVKLHAKIEVARPEDAPVVQAAMPRITDLLQTYLREMRPEELRGSVGTYRLREELLARVDAAVSPVRVEDILFVELMVQ